MARFDPLSTLLAAVSSLRSTGRSAVLASAIATSAADAQVFVNPGFENGTAGWSGCPLEINPQNVYGGVGTNRVAEVDGHNNASITTDDRVLCQSVSGFTIGSVYTLDFDAARRQGGPTPTTVSVNVHLDDALDATVTRTGTWNLVREHLLFTATATTHNLLITPNFTVSYGMLFDNFSITLVSALPVELLYFQAQAEPTSVLLTWATASEHNSAHFTVERSADASQWSTIGQLPAAGHSQEQLVYALRDAQPLRGLSYYRLKQVDLDGTAHLYDATPVYFVNDGEQRLWPNPAMDVLFVRVPNAKYADLQLHNNLGQRMAVGVVEGDANVRLSIGALPAGIYTVHDATGALIDRFLKQ